MPSKWTKNRALNQIKELTFLKKGNFFDFYGQHTES